MNKTAFNGPLEQISDCCYRIPKSYRADMRVDGLIFASEKLIGAIRKDQAAEQVANVATLPGISEGQPGHARYSLGLWLLHRRRVRDRPRPRAASSRPAASATTLTAACGC